MRISVEITDESFTRALNDDDLAQLVYVISDQLGVAFTAVRIIKDPEPGTTDDKLRPGQTVKEALDRCIVITNERLDEAVIHDEHDACDAFDTAAREMKSAQMWYARGRHMQEGSFSPSDVDRWLADGADPAEVVAERDRKAGKRD